MENKDKERFKLIPEVFLLLIKDDKVLLSRRFQTGYEDGNYGVVGGHADGNETMRQAIAREAKEEANITVDLKKLEHFLTMHRWCGDHERIGFYFIAKQWDGEIKNIELNKCDDLSWFLIDQLPENTMPFIQAAIDCYLRGEHYCEFGWDK